VGSARKVSLERSHQTRDKGGGLKPGRAFGDAPGEPALSLASASPSSELGRLEQSRCTCSCAVTARRWSVSALALRCVRGLATVAAPAAEDHRQHRGPDYTPATRRSAARRLWRPRRPRSPRLRSRSASPVAACTVLVVLGQRGAAMHARSALCGREGDSDSS